MSDFVIYTIKMIKKFNSLCDRYHRDRERERNGDRERDRERLLWVDMTI